ncbi:MAG TPA: UDP-N-acetylmuramoyl-L-alanine--D-glutamate ligase, partial [Gemmatimonadales bacterium]|nr:UDP-N-acetylmuramoyl-L-alanine--D-glutamate ligase [Gemmatimonadales bacterium]
MSPRRAIPLVNQWLASGREVAVVGLGKSGLAASLLLRDYGVLVYASDSGSSPAHLAWAETARRAGAAVDTGRHDLERIGHAAAVVVAPGVPPEAAPLEAARRAGLAIYAETDLGFLALEGTRCIGITGTNGKTTTTSLTAHLLAAGGLRAETAGNIGRPLSDVARAPDPPQWLALELSSFQLHDTPHLEPAIGMLLNLSPNHLDRYHSLEEYYGDKALLFRNAHAGSVWISNADDLEVRRMVAPVAGRHLRFSLRARAEGWYDRDGQRLMLGDRPLLPRGELPLLGEHNVANALAAAAAAQAVGTSVEDIVAGLSRAAPVRGRLRAVQGRKGATIIDDSYNANPGS